MVIPMKKIFLFILIISLVSSVSVSAREEEFLSVWDGGSMLSEEAERYIYTQNKIISEKTGARIIIATTLETGELTVTGYAQKLFDDMGIKSIGRNNSILILLCKEEKEYCIKLSDGISAALTEGYAQSCLSQFMEDDFAKENYDDAVLKTFNEFANWYAKQYAVKLSLTEDMSDYKSIIKTEKERKLLKTVLITLGVILATGGALYALIHIRRKKRMQRLLKKRQERRRRYAQSLHGR